MMCYWSVFCSDQWAHSCAEIFTHKCSQNHGSWCYFWPGRLRWLARSYLTRILKGSEPWGSRCTRYGLYPWGVSSGGAFVPPSAQVWNITSTQRVLLNWRENSSPTQDQTQSLSILRQWLMIVVFFLVLLHDHIKPAIITPEFPLPSNHPSSPTQSKHIPIMINAHDFSRTERTGSR